VLPVESPDLLVLCLQAFSHTKTSSESLDQCLGTKQCLVTQKQLLMIIAFILDDLYTGILWSCCGAGVITQGTNCITLDPLICTWVFSMALCPKKNIFMMMSYVIC
jgi:hypothetical protein